MKNYKKILAAVLVTLAFFALVVMNIIQLNQNNRLENRIQSLEMNIHNIQADVSSSLSGVTTQIQEALEQEQSLVSDFGWTGGGLSGSMASLEFYASPKLQQENDRVFFTYSIDGEANRMAEAQLMGMEYRTLVEIPLTAREITYGIVIENGTQKQTGSLGEITDFRDQYVLSLSVSTDSLTVKPEKDGLILEKGDFTLGAMIPEGNYQTLVSAEVVAVVDDQTVYTAPVDVARLSNARGDYENSYQAPAQMVGDGRTEFYPFSLTGQKLPCKMGESVLLYLDAVDSKGIRYRVHIMVLDSQNDPDSQVQQVTGQLIPGQVDIEAGAENLDETA